MTDARHHVEVTADMDATGLVAGAAAAEAAIRRLGESEVAANKRVEASEGNLAKAKDRHRAAQSQLNEAIESGTTAEQRRAARSEKYWAGRLKSAEEANRKELEFLRKTVDANNKSQQQIVDAHRKSNEQIHESDQKLVSMREADRRKDVTAERKAAADRVLANLAEARRGRAEARTVAKEREDERRRDDKHYADLADKEDKRNAKREDERRKEDKHSSDMEDRADRNAGNSARRAELLEEAESRASQARKRADDTALADQLRIEALRAQARRQEQTHQGRMSAQRRADATAVAADARAAERHAASMARAEAAEVRRAASVARRSERLGPVRGIRTGTRNLFRGGGRTIARSVRRLRGAGGGDGPTFRPLMQGLSDFGEGVDRTMGRILPKLASFRGLIVAAVVAMGPLIAAAGGLGAGLIGVGNAIGALVGSLVAVPGLFAAAAAGIGALVIAMIPMANAFKAYNNYLDATRAGSRKNAQEQKDAARNVIALQHAYERAGRAVSESQYDERRSQVALNAARKEAARQLQDLRNEMDKLHLNEEGAILAVKQAEDDYRRVLADGNATALDREQVLHRLKEANFDLRDVRVQNKRTEEDAALAEKRGIDSAEGVVDARHAQKQATEQVAEAQWQLAEAWRQLHKAQDEQTKGGAAAKKAADDLADAMARLSPNARKVAEAIFALHGPWDQFSKRVQDRLFEKLAKDTGLFRSVLREGGGLDKVLGGAATAMGGLADQALRMFAAWDKSGDLAKLSDVINPIITNLGGAVLSVGEGMKNIAIAAKPFTDWLSGAIKGLADRFAEWTKGLQGSGEFQTFLENVKTTLSQLGTIVGNVFKGLFSMFQASAPFTKWFLDRIIAVTDAFASWADTANKDKNSGFRRWLEDTKPLLSSIWDFIKAVGQAIGDMASDPRNIEEAKDILNALAKDVLPALVGIFGKLSESHAISNLIEGFGGLLKAVKEFLDNGGALPITIFVDTLVKAFEFWFKVMKDYPIVGTFFKYLLSGLALLAAFKLTGLWGIAKLLGSIVKLAAGAIGGIAKIGGSLLKPGLDTVTGGRLFGGSAQSRKYNRTQNKTDRKLNRAANAADRRAGLPQGTTAAQRPIVGKLDRQIRLLEHIERNTRRMGGGGTGGAGPDDTRPRGGPGRGGGSGGPGPGRGGSTLPREDIDALERQRYRNDQSRADWRAANRRPDYVPGGIAPTGPLTRTDALALARQNQADRLADREAARQASLPPAYRRPAPVDLSTGGYSAIRYREQIPTTSSRLPSRLPADRPRIDLTRADTGGIDPAGRVSYPSSWGGRVRDRFNQVRGNDSGYLDVGAMRRRGPGQPARPSRIRTFGKYGAIAGGLGAGAFFLPDMLGMTDAAYASDGEVDENGEPIDGSGLGVGAGALGMAAMFAPDLLGMGLDYLPQRGEEAAETRTSRRAESRAARAESRMARRTARGGRLSRVGRLGRLGRLGRAGGGLARAGGGLARGGGGLLRGAGRLLKGGGILGIGGAAVGMLADSGVFGGKGSAGKSLGQAAGATMTGASIGAMVGSVIPGVGTVIGGAIGGLAGFTYSLAKDPKLRKTMSGFFTGIGNWFVSTGKSIGKWFNDWVIRPLVNFFSSIGRWFGRLPGRIGSWITQWIVNPFVGFLSSIGRWIGRLLGRVEGWVVNNLVNPTVGFFSGIGRWIGSLPGRIGNWVTEHVINPVVGFFRKIGQSFRNLPASIMKWAKESGGSLVEKALHVIGLQSGGPVPGTFDGRQDTRSARLTPGEFVIRRDRMQQPDARRLAEGWNSGAFEAKDLYAGLTASVLSAPTMLPAASVSPTSTVVNNSSTRNAGLHIDGPININNPVQEKSDRSLRHTLQTLAYMSRAGG